MHTSYAQNPQRGSHNDGLSSYSTAQPPPQQPCAPSSEYLAKSLEPSTRTQEPTRKLLILDLNGTLVYRPRPKPAPRSSGHRITYARPYLPSFRSYLFHPQTREWLDVMIWSSAQPHSVRSMLEVCFPDGVERRPGGKDDRFAAVWARDTLGLSSADYSPSITPPESQPSDAAFSVQKFHHSQETTLLLDDSALKAHLQPWNHVCIKEYDALAREADLSFFKGAGNTIPKGNSGVLEGSSAAGKILRDTVEKIHPIDANDANQEIESALIAFVGVLETLKYESNVAGWLRNKGLWVKEGDGQQCDPGTENEDTFWFSHLPSYHHWLQMGRAALERLGIEEEAGLDDNDDGEEEAVKGSG
ncbi:hypothetical protein BU17DRAFT_35765 [Hysterangium stoloniferum]|nr:hypothetical protein BU17DRAFT_35765 [Hysterangium stoloniferum]